MFNIKNKIHKLLLLIELNLSFERGVPRIHSNIYKHNSFYVFVYEFFF